MKLIVGLGNPGPRYEVTRHNVGFMVADLIADKIETDFTATKHQALLAQGKWQGERILICKPQTYMNLSGQAVLSLVRWYKLSSENLLVIYDDLDLDVGRLRLRPAGSAGGQKGMAHIIQLLGTEQVKRMRLGIGRPPQGWQAADYVLSSFSDAEWEVLKELLPKAAEAALAVCAEGIDKAMNRFNV